MKKIILCLLIVFFIFPLSITAKNQTDAGATVNIPWTEFSKMLDELEKLKTPPIKPVSPVPFILSQSNYNLSVDKNYLKGSLTLKVSVLNDTWIKAPLLDKNVSIENASINDKPLLLVREGNRFNALIKGPGTFTIKIQFSIPIIASSTQRSISFLVPQSSVTLMKLSIPGPESKVTAKPDAVGTTNVENNSTVYTAFFPSTDRISLEWVTGVKKIEAVKKEPRVFVTTSSLLTVGEGHIRSRTVLDFEILQSGIDNIKITLPKGMNLLSLSPSDNIEWDIQTKDETQILTINLAYPLLGKKTFVIETDLSMNNVSGLAKIGHMLIEPSNRTIGYLSISAKTNVEIKPRKLNNLVRIDQSELPKNIIRYTNDPVLHAFKYVTLPYSLELDITRHKDVAVLTTAADRAELLTLNTGEEEISRCVLYIRNNLRQFLEFQLPSDAVLWATFTNGNPVKPGVGSKKNSVLVPLLKSRPGQDSESSFPVEIVYYRSNKYSTIGGSMLSVLPKVDVPISTLQWEIYTPSKWKVMYTGGDFKKGRIPSSRVSNKSSISNTKYKSYRVKESNVQSQSIVGLKQTDFDNRSGLSKGMLPVRIDIPRVGQYQVFTKNYYNPSTDKQPKIRICYFTSGTVRVFRYLFVIIGFLITILLDKRYLNKKLKCTDQDQICFWSVMKPTSGEFVKLVISIIIIGTFNNYLGLIWKSVILGLILGLIIAIPYRRLASKTQ